MLLTKTFTPEQYRKAFDSWAWLGLEGKTPVLSSLFGDTFLQDADGYWFLDTIGGALTHTPGGRDELQAVLDTEEAQDRYLLGGLAMAAERRGVVLAPNEVYDLMPPPILGGPFDSANVRALDFVVAVNIAGQLHEQIRGMPPGTPVSGFAFNGTPPAASPHAPTANPRRRRWGRRA